MDKFEIKWEAPEFDYKEKGVSWYWLSIILAVLILSASVWQKNFLFAVFVVIAEILILVWAGQKPKIFAFKMDEKGLTMGDKKFYPYSAIGAFAIKESWDENMLELMLRFRHGFHSWLKIRIPIDKSSEINKILSAYAEKIEPEESFLDSLEKLIGF